MADLPARYAQLKYVLFSWPNTPLLKKDGLAKMWFKTHATMSTFASALGGYPLPIYEAALASSNCGVPELFLDEHQVAQLLALLAEEMGPSRAQASWKPTAWHSREALERGTAGGQIRVHRFESQEALEDRFAQLKDHDDWAATKAHWTDLKRAQEVWSRLLDGARSRQLDPLVVAVDIETWEQDHDAITEVGVAMASIRPEGMLEVKAEHFVVAENAHRRNGRYCPDARDDFQLGQSVTLPTAELSSRLQQLFFPPSQPPPTPPARSYSSAASTSSSSAPPPPSPPPPPATRRPLILLLHDPRGDVVSLAQLDLQTNLFERALPSPSSSALSPPSPPPSDPPPALFLLDTQRLYSGWSRRKKQARLEDAAQALGVGRVNVGKNGEADEGEVLKPHNAGNDAWATLQLYLRLMQCPIGNSADWLPDSLRATAPAVELKPPKSRPPLSHHTSHSNADGGSRRGGRGGRGGGGGGGGGGRGRRGGRGRGLPPPVPAARSPGA
ncbi:hypothetical protein JCM8097_003856 [Rhodosporidiobolus ruineniae]